MLVQAHQPVPFVPSDEGGQHSWPPGRSFQLRLARVAFSGLSSPRGHSMCQLRCCVPVVHESTFLCSLRSTPVTEFQRYYGHSDSCSAGSSRPAPMSLVCDAPRQVSLIHAQCHYDHSVSKHPTWRSHRFDTLPLSATACRTRRSRLRHWLAGSPHTPGRIEFVSLRTDRSPPAAPHPASRSDAVAVGYRPESVCLKRTFTSQTLRAFRRTSPAFQRREARPSFTASRSDG